MKTAFDNLRERKVERSLGKDLLLRGFRDSIRAIKTRRLFSTERGYQGRLLTELDKRNMIEKIIPGDAVIEQEYQKSLETHGINIRPDIIIHIPYSEETGLSRASGNFVIIQLKLKANEIKAKEDFKNMDLMFSKLDYPLGIFLNIDSDKTFYSSYSGEHKDRLHCFAVKLSKDKVFICESP